MIFVCNICPISRLLEQYTPSDSVYPKTQIIYFARYRYISRLAYVSFLYLEYAALFPKLEQVAYIQENLSPNL